MTDKELVKRLRDKHCCESPNCNCDEAADRIEALINLNEALVELMDDRDAKLAKAVEALKEALYFLNPTESDMEKKAGIYRIVTTLAEIEGIGKAFDDDAEGLRGKLGWSEIEEEKT